MIQLTLQAAGQRFRVLSPPADVSITLRFNGNQPNTYGVDRATAKAYETGGFVGDTRRGGSCNFERYTLVPHCNGTHTECIGHLALERIAIVHELRESLIPAAVVSVPLRKATACDEAYTVPFGAEDEVISAADLRAACAGIHPDFLGALLIRTRPNDAGKCARDYMQQAPGFFTLDAMQFIRDTGVRHLLTDLPSVDRLFDEGLLGAHRIYWGVMPGEQQVDVNAHSPATITEMIFVPDSVADGLYLLNLQIAPFEADAAPSRPLLYSLQAD